MLSSLYFLHANACSLELDPQKLKADLKLSSFISLFGVLVPFGASCALATAFMNPEYTNTSFINLSLFLTCALGMSALPVLARILSERRMLTTRIGVCTRAQGKATVQTTDYRKCHVSPRVCGQLNSMFSDGCVLTTAAGA